MALIELIDAAMVKVPLMSKNKDGVIRELMDVLAATGAVIDREAALSVVFAREKLGSTGLNDGIAVPHGKTDAVKDLAIALGIAPDGIEFDSMDGKASSLFFLILAPPDKSGPHIQALAEIAKLSRSRALCKAIVHARSSQDVVDLLRGE